MTRRPDQQEAGTQLHITVEQQEANQREQLLLAEMTGILAGLDSSDSLLTTGDLAANLLYAMKKLTYNQANLRHAVEMLATPRPRTELLARLHQEVNNVLNYVTEALEVRHASMFHETIDWIGATKISIDYWIKQDILYYYKSVLQALHLALEKIKMIDTRESVWAEFREKCNYMIERIEAFTLDELVLSNTEHQRYETLVQCLVSYSEQSGKDLGLFFAALRKFVEEKMIASGVLPEIRTSILENETDEEFIFKAFLNCNTNDQQFARALVNIFRNLDWDIRAIFASQLPTRPTPIESFQERKQRRINDRNRDYPTGATEIDYIVGI